MKTLTEELSKIQSKIKKDLDPFDISTISFYFAQKDMSKSHNLLYERIVERTLEPYHQNPYNYHNFAINEFQRDIIYENVNNLNLSPKSKKLVFEETIKQIPQIRLEFHDRFYFKKHMTYRKGLSFFKENIEKDLSQMLSSYLAKNKETDFAVFLSELQIDLMEIVSKKLESKESLEDILIKNEIEIDRYSKDLTDRYLPTHRPTCIHYDEFLFNLSEIIKLDNQYYIPIIDRYLKSFNQKEFTIFQNFEINKESIRMKISKYRKGINKGS